MEGVGRVRVRSMAAGSQALKLAQTVGSDDGIDCHVHAVKMVGEGRRDGA
jgi:hypothetical protein